VTAYSQLRIISSLGTDTDTTPAELKRAVSVLLRRRLLGRFSIRLAAPGAYWTATHPALKSTTGTTATITTCGVHGTSQAHPHIVHAWPVLGLTAPSRVHKGRHIFDTQYLDPTTIVGLDTGGPARRPSPIGLKSRPLHDSAGRRTIDRGTTFQPP
jgi:hypothetical protein